MLGISRRSGAFGLVAVLIYTPILALFPANFPVAEASTTQDLLHCPLSTADDASLTSPSDLISTDFSDPSISGSGSDTASTPDYDVDPDLTSTDFGGDPSLAYIPRSSIVGSPNYTDLLSVLNSTGVPSSDGSGWTVCSAYYNNYLESFQVDNDASTFLDLLANQNGSGPKISFKNPEDAWALTGEPCRKYLADGTCDETLGSNGQPLYYDDIYWTNGHWDAPKVDARILQALVYLVTPVSEGGAGHEYIQVGKITQTSQKDTDFSNANETAAQQAADQQDISSHYYDQSNPEHPSQLAESMDLTQIDNIRVTTKITQKHRIGGDSTSYQYKSFPINVAWQSDQGIAQTPLPQMTDIFTGALQSVSGSFGQLLDSLDLEANVDPTTAGVGSLGDLTKYVGDSLLTTLLQGGSLSGFDLESTLDNFGRSYLAAQLKLPKGALSKGDTVQELTQNIGQTIAEQNLGLPTGSLSGDTSLQIYQSMGARYYETLFKVAPGTLTNISINNQDQFFQALGRGRIEQQYELKPGALIGLTSFSNQLLPLNYKTKSLFTNQYANLVDDDLALTYADSPTVRKYNLNQSSLTDVTEQLISNKIPLTTYELLVGIRTWDTSLGQFTPSTPPTDASTTQAVHDQACTVTPNNSSDGNPDAGTCLSSISGSSFAPYFLQNLGVDLNQVAGIATGPTVGFKGGTRVLTTKPSISDMTAQAMSSSKAQQLLTTKALTQTQLQSLVQSSATILYGSTNSPYSAPTTTSQAAQAPTQLQLASSLKSIVDIGLTPLNNQISQTDNDTTYLPSDDLISADNFLNSADSMLNSDLNNWTSVLSEQNQSGQSAALDLPGSIPQFTSDGTVVPGAMLLNQDPVTQLWNGNLSSLAVIGKLQLAKKLTGDTLSQYSFASQLQTDLSPSFNQINNTLKPVIDVSKIAGFGLTNDDFTKIFQKNLSAQVFQRVGQDALLTKVWNISGATSAVNSAVSSSPALNQIASTITNVATDITFYISHWQQLQTVISQLAEQPGNSMTDAIRQELKQVSTSANEDSTQITNGSSNLQTLIRQINSETDTVSNLVNQANTLINEIIAGHDLSFSQSAGVSTTNIQASACWSQLALQGSLTNLQAKVKDISIGVGACELENSLNLPTGSILGFYNQFKSGGTPSLTDLEASVGRADYGTNTYPTYDQAVTRGKQVLERKGISSLVQTIPGVSSALGQFGLTADSIFGLIQGQSEPVKITLGGFTLDTKLQLPNGTMKNVVAPSCDTPPCSDQQMQDSRSSALAKAGMKQLTTALNLPAGIDITGGGNFATNYGKSYLSQNLGLATNSFDGPFSEMASKNSPDIILSTFGLGDTLYDTNLRTIAHNLIGLGSKLTSSDMSTSNVLVGTITNQVKDNWSTLLGEMQDPNSTIYSNPANPEAFAAPLEQSYANTIKDLMDQAGSVTAVSQIIQPYSDALAESPNYGESTVGSQITAYQQRLHGLDLTYALAPGTFAKYILGQVDASAINQTVGQQQGESKLADSAVNNLLNSNDNPLIQEVVSGLKDATKSSSCPNGMTIGQLLVGTGSQSGCQASSLAHVDLSKLLTGTDANSKQERGILYDSLLGRTFGAQLENSMHLPVGTIRNFALNPRQAPEIALTSGLNAIADQLFQTSTKDSAFTNQAKLSLRTAFLAGFYDVNTNQYGYDFNSQHSLHLLKTSLQQMEQQELSTYSKQYLGTSISLSDLQDIASGDPTGLLYVGLQRFAFSTNQQLQKQAANDPRAAAFQLNYADIRNAVGFGPVSFEENATAYYYGAASELKSYYNNGELDCTDNPDWCNAIANTGPNDFAAQQAIVNGTLANSNLSVQASTINNAGIQNAANYDANRKKIGQQNLQYHLYDIAAFQIDKDIPAGFAKAMLAGNDALRSNVLGQFAFNALNLKDSSLGGFLNAAEVGDLTQFAQSHFTDTSRLSQVEIDGLNGWATSQFQKEFGIDLPPGAMAGFIGWASTGFASSEFSSAKITQGPFACAQGANCKFSNVVPIGSVLKNWGDEKLFAWGDKVLGFDVGGTYKIYQSAQAVLSAQKAVTAAEDSLIFTKVFGSQADFAAAKTAVSAASSKLVAAKTDVITTVITVVFAKQIGQAETQLGLVPGTGAEGVTILGELIAHAFFGGPAVSLVAIALFIGMNLFGVYKTTIETSATADGYYPYRGGFGSTGLADGNNPSTVQSPSSLGYAIGEFNPKDSTSYHDGVEQAAQAKVQGLLADLLHFPEQWGKAQGIDPQKLYISQVFTLRDADLEQLDSLISQPSPKDNPPGLGYGPIAERVNKDDIYFDTSTQEWKIDTTKGNPYLTQIGYFTHPAFWNQIYVRW